MRPRITSRLSAAVVGLRLRVEAVEGVWKLSQNKAGTPDYAGVVAGLSASPFRNERAVAAAMVETA